MSNHAARRPRPQQRTVVRPRMKTSVRAGGNLLPAIPRPWFRVGGLVVKCGSCRRWGFSLKGYQRHYVCAHIYGEVIK